MTSIQNVQLPDTPLSVLQQTAVKALRRYLNDGGTDDLRKVAVCLVDSREHFITTEGEPDWKGNSNAYRKWSRETYDLAGVPRDRLSSVQAAVRYHVSIVIREKLDPDTLSDLGLLDQSSRQRSAQRHATTYDLAGLFGQGGRITDTEQIAAAVKAMVTTLRRIDMPEALATGGELPTAFERRLRDLRAGVDELVVEYHAARRERNAYAHGVVHRQDAAEQARRLRRKADELVELAKSDQGEPTTARRVFTTMREFEDGIIMWSFGPDE